MSDVLESAKAHFRDKLSGELLSVEVPEWLIDGKPVKIYYKPSLNFAQQEKVLALADQNKKAEAIVQSLIERSLDENGQKMFKQVNRLELMKQIDPAIISRIVGEMSGDDETMDDYEKN